MKMHNETYQDLMLRFAKELHEVGAVSYTHLTLPTKA